MGRFNQDNRGPRRDENRPPQTNARVGHIYDHSAKGTLVRNNNDETLVGVIWDSSPKVLHPCLREELWIPREPKVERPRRDRDDDRGGFRRNRDDDDSFVAGR